MGVFHLCCQVLECTYEEESVVHRPTRDIGEGQYLFIMACLLILGTQLHMIDTDASKYQLGAALLQQQDEEDPKDWNPIGFYSKTLNETEQRYSTTELECYAVVWSVLYLRPYIEGTHFKVRTDYEALKWLMTLTDPSGRLTRWRLRLAEFDYEITYRPGRVHQVPDALSRIETSGVDKSPVDDEIPSFDPTMVVTRS